MTPSWLHPGLALAPIWLAALFPVRLGELQDLDRGDDLAGVALRVVGAMNENTAHSRRQLLFAYHNEFMEAIWRDGADSLGCPAKPGAKLVKDIRNGSVVKSTGIEFAVERIKLCGAELPALRVGEQAVQRARNVAQMEDNGRKPGRTLQELIVAHGLAPEGGIFAAEIQGMKDAAADGVEFVVGITEPRLGEGRCLHQEYSLSTPSSTRWRCLQSPRFSSRLVLPGGADPAPMVFRNGMDGARARVNIA